MNNNMQARRQVSASKNQPIRFNIWEWWFGGGQWG